MHSDLPNLFSVGGHQTLHIFLITFFLKWEFIFITYDLQDNKIEFMI